MSHQSIEKCELVSALADGQLDAAEFESAMDALAGDADARASWHAYHLAGDVLRTAELSAHVGNGGFVTRFQARLAGEALVARPAVAQAPAPVPSALAQRPSANESQFRWKLVAGLASVVALAALSWTAVGPLPGGASAPRLAQAVAPGAQTVAVAGPGRQVMIRDPRLDQLLVAHKQFGGTSALQMPAGFLRNATYEEPSR